MQFPCPNCGKMLSAPDELAGKQAKCKVCAQVITVPGVPPEEQGPIEMTAVPPPPGVKIQPAQISTQPPPAAPGIRAAALFAYAGFWRRFVAVIIDGFILSAVNSIILLTLGRVMPAQVGNFLGIVIGWLYYALMESSMRQATLGKMALGLMVTDLNGQKVSFARATGRHFAKIISALILFIGFLMAGFTSRKQALHDMLAGCLVVRKW